MGVLCAKAGRVPVKQRGKPFEQGGNLLVVEQSRGDEELAGPAGDEGRVAFDDSLDVNLVGKVATAIARIGLIDRLDGIRPHGEPPASRPLEGVRRLFPETLP